MYYSDWKPYVPVAARRRKAAKEIAKLSKKGVPVSPVVITGRAIARTFWGKAWCDNLERYSDYSNRLPRGRTYVRNGSVLDLQVAPGAVSAGVIGSLVNHLDERITTLSKARWKSVCADCAGAIDSLVELLQGRLSKGVMERLCRPGTGLFPQPSEISFTCTCPDWASMCKHVAAVLYGIGARLDDRPELLFALRHVDESALIATAGARTPLTKRAPAHDKVLASADLSELFGLEMAAEGLTGRPRARSNRIRRSARAAIPATRAGERREAEAVKPRATAKKARSPRSKGSKA